MLGADGVAMPMAAALASWLVAPETGLWHAPWFWLVVIAVSLLVFHFQGLYRTIVHFVGIELIGHAFESVTVACWRVPLGDWLAGPLIGLKFGITFLVLGLTYVAGSRFVVRLLLRARHIKGDRVLIYGAGEAGAHLANALMERADFVPVGFVDDNVSLDGTVINGLEVYAPREECRSSLIRWRFRESCSRYRPSRGGGAADHHAARGVASSRPDDARYLRPRLGARAR